MTTTKKITPAVEAEVIEPKSTSIVEQKNDLVKTDADIDGYITLRQNFIKKVNAICVEGKDYHVIQGRKSLAKGGAEKIASIFKWTAKFEKDNEALEMLGEIKGLVAFKCTLVNGQFVGEGRGAALLSKNNSDPNRTLKMAQKSAFIDATLRASGLSDFFTQDLEDMPKEEISQPQSQPRQQAFSSKTDIKPSEAQLNLIAKLMKEKGYTKLDLYDMGFGKLTGGKGGTASELIDVLIKSKGKLNPANGEPMPEELPVIDVEAQEMTEEERKLVEEIPF